jgi:hypothetical protein
MADDSDSAIELLRISRRYVADYPRAFGVSTYCIELTEGLLKRIDRCLSENEKGE